VGSGEHGVDLGGKAVPASKIRLHFYMGTLIIDMYSTHCPTADLAGVQKEYFQMVIESVFDTANGMFQPCEGRCLWINGSLGVF
jgi:hypothetical protein